MRHGEISKKQHVVSETYRLKGKHWFSCLKFRFEYRCELKAGDTRYSWKTRVVNMPHLKRRDSSNYRLRLYGDSNGNRWINWDSRIYSLKDVRMVAHLWANYIQKYIETGWCFDAPPKETNYSCNSCSKSNDGANNTTEVLVPNVNVKFGGPIR